MLATVTAIVANVFCVRNSSWFDSSCGCRFLAQSCQWCRMAESWLVWAHPSQKLFTAPSRAMTASISVDIARARPTDCLPSTVATTTFGAGSSTRTLPVASHRCTTAPLTSRSTGEDAASCRPVVAIVTSRLDTRTKGKVNQARGAHGAAITRIADGCVR